MTRNLVSVDTRKKLAVYEEDGERKCIPVQLDSSGNPVLDAETEAELQKRFARKKRRPVIPDSPFVRSIPVTKIQRRTS